MKTHVNKIILRGPRSSFALPVYLTVNLDPLGIHIDCYGKTKEELVDDIQSTLIMLRKQYVLEDPNKLTPEAIILRNKLIEHLGLDKEDKVDKVNKKFGIAEMQNIVRVAAEASNEISAIITAKNGEIQQLKDELEAAKLEADSFRDEYNKVFNELQNLQTQINNIKQER